MTGNSPGKPKRNEARDFQRPIHFFTKFRFESSSRRNVSEMDDMAGGRVCGGRFDQQLAKR